MKYLIDSNIFIYLAGGDTEAWEAITKAAKAEWAGFSSITRLEVLGYPGLSTADEEKLRDAMREFNEVAVSPSIIDRAIIIRKRQRIKTPDAIIAATAFHCTATLITRNASDFANIEELLVHNPYR